MNIFSTDGRTDGRTDGETDGRRTDGRKKKSGEGHYEHFWLKITEIGAILTPFWLLPFGDTDVVFCCFCFFVVVHCCFYFVVFVRPSVRPSVRRLSVVRQSVRPSVCPSVRRKNVHGNFTDFFYGKFTEIYRNLFTVKTPPLGTEKRFRFRIHLGI